MSTRRNFFVTAAAGLPIAAAQQQPAPTPVSIQPAPAGDIFEAADKGALARVKELAAQNPWIARLRSPDGWTPLHLAARGGHQDVLAYLMQQGADLSAGPVSPLLFAVDYPEHDVAAEMSRTLLMNGSDPNARRADGKPALEVARARGYADIAGLLLHRGAASDQAVADRVYFGRRYSFDAEGRPYSPEKIDGLPQEFINRFVSLAHFDVVQVKHLLKIAPGLLEGRATWDEMAVEAAAHMGLVDLAKHLADHGAPVSTCTATLLGLQSRVEALVGSDHDCIHERGAHDIALLAYTAYGEQRTSIADFLMRAGADVHSEALGVTTLHVAAGKGYTEVAELLISHGADVNAAGRLGKVTPLGVAIRSKQDKMADFLRARGGRA